MPPREQTAARQNNGSPNSSQSFGLCSKKKWVVSSGDLFALPVAPGVGGERGDNFEVEASWKHNPQIRKMRNGPDVLFKVMHIPPHTTR
mmetsp:Transcript_82806/g.222097  ORF Transcript_82806/g.222097 Transcript_82806/m.222097 type:complete len:89 (-) Transcript_82806:314-580(-)